jgi:hypothetical protein
LDKCGSLRDASGSIRVPRVVFGVLAEQGFSGETLRPPPDEDAPQ